MNKTPISLAEILITELKKHQRPDIDQTFIQKYLGTPRHVLGVRSADLKKVAKKFLKEHELNDQQLIHLLSDLYTSDLFEARAVAGFILGNCHEFRSRLAFDQLESWLQELVGWCEIDTSCQHCFTAPEVLLRWSEWKSWITHLSESDSISLRRASLVLQNISVGESSESKLSQLATKTITTVIAEKDILITKAISWLLRSMIKQHRQTVSQYLADNLHRLPKIAIRETNKKLTTGKKN